MSFSSPWARYCKGRDSMTAGRRSDAVVCLAGVAWAAALLCLAGPPAGDQQQRTAVGRAQGPPQIDGRLSEPCRAAATALTSFELNVDAGGAAANQTRARLCFDQTHLYLAVEVARPEVMPTAADLTVARCACVDAWARHRDLDGQHVLGGADADGRRGAATQLSDPVYCERR